MFYLRLMDVALCGQWLKYCVDNVKGIGAKRAKDLIDKHRSIENILEHLDPKKYTVPEDWPFAEARRLFKEPVVTDPDTIEVSFLQYPQI